MSGPAEKEPSPKKGDIDIYPLVMADLMERVEYGRKKYGTVLQAGNGRDPNWDAYQEALDLAVYLRQAIEERKLLEEALILAANALDVAADWGICDVQINPPKEWELETYQESAEGGWCDVSELAKKLRSFQQRKRGVHG